jgi:hypothetical protein
MLANSSERAQDLKPTSEMKAYGVARRRHLSVSIRVLAFRTVWSLYRPH